MTKLDSSELGILADDLTGACDVAACFVPVTGSVTVLVAPGTLSGEERCLAVINTASRAMSAEESRAAVHSVGLQLSRKRVIFKKICSALRGNVGAEVEGLLQAAGGRKVIMAPAIPKIGRTTRGGIQFDGGIPIDETAYAFDPVSPIRTARIAEIVAETGKVECQVEDARTENDLRAIVAMALENAKVVLVGSLGLADALAEYIEPDIRQASNGPVPKAYRILLLCGSPYPQAQEQISRSVSHYGAQSILLGSVTAVNAFREWPRGVTALIVRTTDKIPGRPGETLAGFIHAVTGLINRLKPDGLGIIGGETAFHLLRQLQVTRLAVHGQMAEVIPCGTMADGVLAGRPFTMKGGSVGPKNAAIIMIEYLRNGNMEK